MDRRSVSVCLELDARCILPHSRTGFDLSNLRNARSGRHPRGDQRSRVRPGPGDTDPTAGDSTLPSSPSLSCSRRKGQSWPCRRRPVLSHIDPARGSGCPRSEGPRTPSGGPCASAEAGRLGTSGGPAAWGSTTQCGLTLSLSEACRATRWKCSLACQPLPSQSFRSRAFLT